ncbi:MAG: YafY family transcriptional regulator [Acidobacteriia bacterium]|nr:YafY family transcriptional regulator [Terriglobia bacterium]
MRADRLLSILLLLQIHRRITARELAERLEVSERTILRDMDALSSTGVPVVAERGAGGGWSLVDGYQVKLTGLNAAEIQSLFMPRPSQLLADLGLHQPSEAALVKLAAALPPTARQQAEFARRRILIDSRGWRDPAESIASLPILLDALWRERKLKFLYTKGFETEQPCEPTARIVSPLGLVAKGNIWYLVAQVQAETRTYRVSRIREAAVLDEPVLRPADFDLAAYWNRSATLFREQLPRYYATFLVESGVMKWARYRGWRLEEETPMDGRVRIRIRFDIEEEALQFALSFGSHPEVLEPAELRSQVMASAEAILRRGLQ